MNGSSSPAPELADLSGPHHHEHLPGLGQHLEDVIDESRKIVGGRDGGLVVPKRCLAQISVVDGREQERCVGKDSFRFLRANTVAGPATATMRSGLGPSANVDTMKSTTACSDAPTDPAGPTMT